MTDWLNLSGLFSIFFQLPLSQTVTIIVQYSTDTYVTHILETCAFLKPFLDRAT